MRPKLGRAAIKKLHGIIESLFQKAKSRLLGTPLPTSSTSGKQITFAVKPELTLTGIFTSANLEERNKPDQGVLDQLLHVAGGYLDAQKEAAKSRVVHAVDAVLQEAHQKGKEADVGGALKEELADIWQKAKVGVAKIAESEATKARNIGVLDGIIKIAAAFGVNDPTLAWLGPMDKDTCDECKRLYFLADLITPRVWKLSEIGFGYHKKGDATPKLGGLHPNERHSLVYISPGYGFKGGAVTYIGPGHDEWAKQRGVTP